MKKTLLFLMIFNSYFIFSQDKSFYDFIVLNSNDTIYGKFQLDKFVSLKGKKIKIKKKGIISIKKNDLIYNLKQISKNDYNSPNNDSLIAIENDFLPTFKKEGKLFLHKLKKELRKDFIVNNKDTIFGRIESKLNINKYKQYVDGKELNIDPKNTPQFRMNGFKYFYKEKRRINPSDKKQAFLKLIYNGKVNLYEYKTLVVISGISSQIEIHYYIEKNGIITLINPLRFYQIIKRVMPENTGLHSIIRKRKFNYKDIYMVIKYHNEF